MLLVKTITVQLPPSDWKRPPGRPNHTQLRATESDLIPLNIGPSYTWKKAASREHWRSTADAAKLKESGPWREREREESIVKHHQTHQRGRVRAATARCLQDVTTQPAAAAGVAAAAK